MSLSIEPYIPYLKAAIHHFWDTHQKQQASNTINNRSAVTGGKQLDGFLTLFTYCRKEPSPT